jgi:hypothetical protein
MLTNLPYEQRVVAFIDILGFRSLVEKLKSNQLLHNELHLALAEIKSYKNPAGDENTAQAKIEASVFSDSIVISADVSNGFQVFWSCIGLQTRLLELKILTRGGISRGLTVHKDDILYGEGMLKAYDLESKNAIYPRVVVDPEFIADLPSGYKKMFLSQDVDGLWYTDPFAFGVLPPGSQNLLEDGYDPHLFFLDKFIVRIEEEINNAQNVSCYAKWHWLKSKCNEAISFHKIHGKPRMWTYIDINKKTE